MYTILIADDEKIERNGIKSLISRFSFPLHIVEAKNGKEALEYLEANAVDILLTDIKMPFMDGLELAKHARALKPNLKIIIFSAYGEFEYAKKAIGLNVFHYILKPIDVDEFHNVISKVIQLCRDDEEARENRNKILEGYEKGITYEKEKLLFQLLNTAEIDDEFGKKADFVGLDYQTKTIQLLFIDCNKRFFDIKGDDFKNMLDSMLEYRFDVLSINERQCILFVWISRDNRIDKQEIQEIAEKIKEWFCKSNEMDCSIIIGKPVDNIEGVSREYNLLEQALEYRFFIEDSTVLWAEDYVAHSTDVNEDVDSIIDKIYKLIEIKDYQGIKQHMEELFESFRRNESLSAIYVKHIFLEIIRRIFGADERNDISKFRAYMEEVYTCNNISHLKDILSSIFSEIYSNCSVNNDEAGRKVIERIFEIISKEYMNDIGVEYLADMVYLSPNYLGHLFRKNTGKNLTKYIMEYRMARAKELLETTNLKIVDISEKTGFANKSYFTLIFKNYFGITPAQYREKI